MTTQTPGSPQPTPSGRLAALTAPAPVAPGDSRHQLSSPADLITRLPSSPAQTPAATTNHPGHRAPARATGRSLTHFPLPYR